MITNIGFLTINSNILTYFVVLVSHVYYGYLPASIVPYVASNACAPFVVLCNIEHYDTCSAMGTYERPYQYARWIGQHLGNEVCEQH